MSSREFSAELTPDPHLRNTVLLSAVMATVGGFALVLHLPLHGGLRALIAALWLVQSAREIRRWTDGAARVALIQVSQSGDVRVTGRDGRMAPVELLRGTLVTRRMAWIRIRFTDGRKYGELLRGNAVIDKQWHRLQLIWQQTRQNIGRSA